MNECCQSQPRQKIQEEKKKMIIFKNLYNIYNGKGNKNIYFSYYFHQKKKNEMRAFLPSIRTCSRMLSQ